MRKKGVLILPEETSFNIDIFYLFREDLLKNMNINPKGTFSLIHRISHIHFFWENSKKH